MVCYMYKYYMCMNDYNHPCAVWYVTLHATVYMYKCYFYDYNHDFYTLDRYCSRIPTFTNVRPNLGLVKNIPVKTTFGRTSV